MRPEGVELTLRGDKDRTIGLYERLGFVKEGERRPAALLDGVDKNIFLMATVDLAPWTPPATQT